MRKSKKETQEGDGAKIKPGIAAQCLSSGKGHTWHPRGSLKGPSESQALQVLPIVWDHQDSKEKGAGGGSTRLPAYEKPTERTRHTVFLPGEHASSWPGTRTHAWPS